MVVYLDRVFLLNLLVDYLLLLSAAQLSGRTLSRLRLLLCAAGGGLYAVATFLPGCSFLRGPLCQLAAGGAMALCAFRGRRRPALLFCCCPADWRASYWRWDCGPDHPRHCCTASIGAR